MENFKVGCESASVFCSLLYFIGPGIVKQQYLRCVILLQNYF